MTACSHSVSGSMRTFVLACLTLGGLLLPTADRSSAQEVALDSQDHVTTLTVNGRLLLEYQSQSHPTKIYISRWFTPQGVQVLRDSPHDHVHHHALMYAIGIDDIDFWSEVPAEQYGKQVSSGISASSSTTNGKGAATIQQTIDWVSPKEETLGTESRTITAHLGVLPDASLLSWKFVLKPGPGKDSMKLWGRHYFGLGIRFVESMDQGSEFFTAGDAKAETVRGSEKLTRAAWCACFGNADGKPLTLAMFNAPDNPRRPATWFTMNDPFAYLSATLDLDKEPLTVVAEKPLRACYGIAVWDGKIDKDVIEQAYQKWLEVR